MEYLLANRLPEGSQRTYEIICGQLHKISYEQPSKYSESDAVAEKDLILFHYEALILIDCGLEKTPPRPRGRIDY